MMTLRRLRVFIDRAKNAPFASAWSTFRDLDLAIDQRVAERGPSKLARRMRRKRALGMAGAF